MFLYYESGVAYTQDWTWYYNGEYPVITFGKFMFKERFHISKNGVELVEGVDYKRILRSKDVLTKFGVDIFGGVVLLSKEAVTLDIFGVDSAQDCEVLPKSTTSPDTVIQFSTINPMDGSYQNVVDMINEIDLLMPYMTGVSLPMYTFMRLGAYRPKINFPSLIHITYKTLHVKYGRDERLKDGVNQPRSDFIGGLDAMGMDA